MKNNSAAYPEFSKSEGSNFERSLSRISVSTNGTFLGSDRAAGVGVCALELGVASNKVFCTGRLLQLTKFINAKRHTDFAIAVIFM